MHRRIRRFPLSGWLAVLVVIFVVLPHLAACRTLEPVDSGETASPVVTPVPTPTIQECEKLAEPHEIASEQGSRITLSNEEWDQYLHLLQIRSLCIPVGLGSPFLNADWNEAEMPAEGRMMSIGFEHTYHGSGWSDLFLLYSTYDFSTGTEFDRFASQVDRTALLDHALKNEVNINGTQGFLRYQGSQWGYEGQPQRFYKTYIFPFEEFYVAVIYTLGAYEEESDLLIEKFEQNWLPEDRRQVAILMEELVNSLHFE